MAQKTRRLSITINSIEDILNITNFAVASNLLKQWNVDSTGVQNTQQAISRLSDYWVQANGEVPAKKEKQVKNGLQTALAQDQETRESLCDWFNKVFQFYTSLPPRFKDDLCRAFNSFEHTFKERENEVKSRECTILISGEGSSGKSSLINVLLGEEILPTSELPCTSCVCEVRKSKDGKKSAVIISKARGEKRRKPPTLLDLELEDGVRKLGSYVTCLDPDTEESPYDRIEIYWPLQMLQEGIVIVDSPGLGQSGVMQYVDRYLGKSFGFIYVLNSANAGGIQKGRLQDFLRRVVHSSEEDFNPSTSLFVCNKWDCIPESDKNAVKRYQFDKLRKLYPGVRESQLVYVSLKECQHRIKYNSTSPEMDLLMSALQDLLPNSLRNKLSIGYRWLATVLKRSHYSLKVGKVMDNQRMEDKLKTFDTLKNKIDRLETKANYSLADLRKNVHEEAAKTCNDVLHALRSREMTSRLMVWKSPDCPSRNEWKRVAKDCSEKIAERIAIELNIWERNNGVIAGLKSNIIKKFREEFELLEHQVHEIEGVMVDGDARLVTELHQSICRQAPPKVLFKQGKRDSKEGSDPVRGLGGAVSTAGGLDTSDKNLRSLLKNYDSNCGPKIMAEATRMYIESIFQSHLLQDKLHKYFKRYIRDIDAIADLIPNFLRADRQLMTQLEQELGDTEGNLKDFYPTLLRECTSHLGKLDMLFMKNIMSFDFLLSDLIWDQTEQPIGSGTFADVYLACLKQGSDKIDVALKVFRAPINHNTVSEVLLEDNTLRDLKHENVVQYYGATCRQSNKNPKGPVQWVMILEYCPATLKDKFVDGEANCPAHMGSVYSLQIEAMKHMARFAVQICRGVEYLHKKELVHRDLKLDNILVTQTDIVKLTDVGLTKHQKQMTGTVAGSPVYMAPEVLTSKGLYNRKADIYSLAIVLWEMWYGIDAAKHIGQHLYGTLETAVEEGLRPSLTLSHKPPEDWISLIKSTWEYEPTKRPEVGIILHFFEDFLKKYK